jgi:antirestriction protein ArdC
VRVYRLADQHSRRSLRLDQVHELFHWTAAEARRNRQLGKGFGDDACTMEKSIAELGAAFLCVIFASPTRRFTPNS